MAIVGRVTWHIGDDAATATLHHDGSWTFDGDALMATPMRTRAAVLEYGGPSDGAYGARMLRELARTVGGVADLVPTHPRSPGDSD